MQAWKLTQQRGCTNSSHICNHLKVRTLAQIEHNGEVNGEAIAGASVSCTERVHCEECESREGKLIVLASVQQERINHLLVGAACA